MSKEYLNPDDKIIKFPDGGTIDDEKSGDNKSKFNITLKTFFSYIVIAVVAIMLVALVFSDNSFNATNKVNESVINLSTATNYDFEPYREGYILAKDGKIHCYNTNQELQWEVSGAKTTPKIKVNSKYVLVYYPENTYAVITNGKNTKKIKTQGKITYGYINKKGYSVLFYEESGLKEKIVVYNNKGEKIFYRDNPDKYISYAILSDNNRSLITIELKTNNNLTSHLTVHDIRKNKRTASLEFKESLVGGCTFVKKDKFIVVLPTKIICYDTQGKFVWESDHGEKQIYKYSISDNGLIALLFNEDDSAISDSELIVVNKKGKEVGNYKTKKKIYDIDIRDKNILLTMDRQLQLINSKGKFLSSVSVPYDFKETFYIANKKCALVITNSHIARLIIPKQSR